MVRTILSALGLLVASAAWAQQSTHDNFDQARRAVSRDNVGLFGGLAVNTSGSFVSSAEGYSHSAKGATSFIPTIGAFYQKSLGEHFSLRLGVAFGLSSFAYRYAPEFDSLGQDGAARLSHNYKSYERVKHSVGFVQPQIDIGYIFGPVKQMYIIEARAGIALPCYLAFSNDSVNLLSTGVVSDPENKGSIEYYTQERSYYGGDDVWGGLAGTAYLGLRWVRTSSSFLNHSSLGIQATFSVSEQNLGRSEIEYYAKGGGWLLGRDVARMGFMAFGIRYTYSFL